MPLTLRQTLPRLDPKMLDTRAAEAVRGLMHEGSSANTALSYRTAIRYWAVWFELRYGQAFALPLPASAVVQFIVDHVERLTALGPVSEMPPELDNELIRLKAKARPGAPSLNTVSQRLSVLSKAHELHALANPCRDAQVRELMQKARGAYARRGIVHVRKDALTREPLLALLATCDDSLRGTRDRALLLFAWASGGRRRSEVVRATVENTERGPDGYIYRLEHSKTNQHGSARPENAKPLVGPAAQALEKWLERSKITSGALFRRIRRGDIVGEPLAAAAVRDIVRQRCAQAGITGNFSAHSLRAGFVTEAGRQNVPLAETMAMTGHASVKTVMGYFHAGAMAQSRAARLLDTDTPNPTDTL
jgi:integrase